MEESIEEEALKEDACNADAANLLPEADGAARDPYTVKRWISWAEAVRRSEVPVSAELGVLERAVAALPGSYKLWRLFAKRAVKLAERYHPTHAAREHAVQVSLRAARALRAAPRLWEDAIEICAMEGRLNDGRIALDAAFRALPLTQHDRVWRVALECFVPLLPSKAGEAMLSRYAQLRPLLAAERLFDARVKAGCWDEAVGGALGVLSGNANWRPQTRTRGELWAAAIRIAVAHPDTVKCVDVAAALRTELRARSQGLATTELYVLLARYYVRRGDFDAARAVYEQAVTSVNSVRDFAVLYDAYAKFEERLITIAMEELDEVKAEGDAADPEELLEVTEGVEKLMQHLERLAERRPTLLSDVRLRQNPHNVHEWHRRARMYKKASDAAAVVDAYTKAVAAVDPLRATNGRPHTLWLAFASYYEAAGDLGSARKVLDKAVEDGERFGRAHDYAAVWCEYAEMEVRHNEPRRALKILVTATTQPAQDREHAMKRAGGVVAGANGIVFYDHSDKGKAWSAWRSTRLWAFLLDLVTSLEPPDRVAPIHDRMLDAGAASVQTVLNGATWLCARRRFEEAFRLYERATAMLTWPDALRIWASYLTAFEQRYSRNVRKRERVRALFESALVAAPSTKRFGMEIPSEYLPLLFARYAAVEERLGAPRRALSVLSRACTAVASTDRAALYRLYASRATSLFGATRSRPVYTAALAALPRADDVLAFATRFAALETGLGELDRARAVYIHAARVADPRAPSDAQTPSARFWKAWHDFELAHGAEDSFRDMLRARRAVLLRTSDAHLPSAVAGGAGSVEIAAQQNVDVSEDLDKEDEDEIVPKDIAELERRAIIAAADDGPSENGDKQLNDVESVDSTPKKDANGTQDSQTDASTFESAKRKRQEGEDGNEVKTDTESKKPMGALERFKRLRK